MKLDLGNRVAIVTGGSRGIGKSIAQSLSREGVKVVICARDKKALSIVQKEIREAGGNVITVSSDVTDPRAVQRVIDAAVRHFGALDILVNNAGGVKKFAGFGELHDEDWMDSFRLNVMNIVHFVKYSLPLLRKSSAARIINISSISGIQPGSYNPHYTVTKSAVINLSKYLANDLAGDRITVNAVCPGPVHSDAWDSNVRQVALARGISVDDARLQVDREETAKIPLGRIGEGEDVAGLVTFLASDEAAWITGSCFHVNGGKLRSMS